MGQSRYWLDGWFGRGDVQLTHEANYSGPIRDAVLKLFGIDIHANPDLVLRGDISAFVVIEGVTRGVTKRPDFTTFALEDFLNATKTDYPNARKTVNPGEKDSYEKVAGYARAFEAALVAGGMPAVAARLPKALGTAAPVPFVPIPSVVPPLSVGPAPLPPLASPTSPARTSWGNWLATKLTGIWSS